MTINLVKRDNGISQQRSVKAKPARQIVAAEQLLVTEKMARISVKIETTIKIETPMSSCQFLSAPARSSWIRIRLSSNEKVQY
jgi:hypothetical protein